jgi:hypothetical protein
VPVGVRDGRGDGRVPAEADLARRAEVSDVEPVDRLRKGDEESGLREADVGGDRLHPGVVEARGVEDDTSRVATRAVTSKAEYRSTSG